MRVLVTGATGFVRSAAVRERLDTGAPGRQLARPEWAGRPVARGCRRLRSGDPVPPVPAIERSLWIRIADWRPLGGVIPEAAIPLTAKAGKARNGLTRWKTDSSQDAYLEHVAK
jgi:hypothetical protein